MQRGGTYTTDRCPWCGEAHGSPATVMQCNSLRTRMLAGYQVEVSATYPAATVEPEDGCCFAGVWEPFAHDGTTILWRRQLQWV